MRAFLVAMMLPALAWARAGGAAVERYNEPWAGGGARAALVARLERLAQDVALRAGRPLPEVDPRLEAAARSLLPFVPSGAPPPNDLVEESLRLQGIIEPSPHLVVVSLVEGGDASLQAELESRLPGILAQGRYRRVGVATAPVADDKGARTRILMAFQESYIELSPVPRRLAAGGAASLAGRVTAPYGAPELFVTAPGGAVAKTALGGPGAAAGQIRAEFRCGATAGRYQVEITGEDRFGPAVLANFPIYCGVAAPVALAPVGEGPARPWSGAADAERQIAELLERDRARAGLRTLRLDPELSALARAHSEDMRDHGFFGHVSPATGSADDRLKRRGIAVPLVLENVGRAYSPAEAQRGLMDSPGHRGNILNGEVERVGIGVAVAGAEGGARELYVTQLFVRYPQTFRAEHAPEELRARVDALRREQGIGPLQEDPALDGVAREVAQGIAAGTLPRDKPGAPPDGPLAKALPKLGVRYSALRTVVAQAAEVSQVGASPALLDPKASHAGVAVVAGKADAEGRGLFVVLVLGVKR